jgi:hypothetical protein
MFEKKKTRELEISINNAYDVVFLNDNENVVLVMRSKRFDLSNARKLKKLLKYVNKGELDKVENYKVKLLAEVEYECDEDTYYEYEALFIGRILKVLNEE